MIKTVQHTCATTLDGSTMKALIQLGFVPNRVTIRNRTSCVSMEWTTNTATYGYKIGADGAVTYTTDCALTVVDGSDKSTAFNGVSINTFAQGFILPVITDINDTGSEILDITAERTDL